MKKSRMPARLKIGGINYKVLYPYLFISDPSLLGLHDGDMQELKISELFCNKKRNWHKICESLLHEVLHAIDKVYCGNVMAENEIYVMSSYIYQIIRDNDLNIKKGKIPDVVKIGGFYYTVDNTHEYVDDENLIGSIDHESAKIIMSTSRSATQKYGTGAAMSTFIHLLTCAICEMSTIPRGFAYADETNGCVNHQTAFANGIYQVFVDNDFERLLKSDAELK